VVRDFVAREVEPNLAAWEQAGVLDRSLYATAGEVGLLGLDVDEKYGGGGVADFRYNLIIIEELCRAGASALTMNISGFNDLVAPYPTELGTEEQKGRWLPGLYGGTAISALAMTEPGTGSDLKAIRSTAVRRGDEYVVNGAKTFISNGILADVVITVVSTDPAAGANGISLLVLERGMPGFERGPKLDKIGLPAQDTAELSFTDVRVPAANLLGEEGRGFGYLMRNLPRSGCPSPRPRWRRWSAPSRARLNTLASAACSDSWSLASRRTCSRWSSWPRRSRSPASSWTAVYRSLSPGG